MSLFLKLISSYWFWADVLLSISGGIVVWWGLRIEKEAEKLLIPSDFKPDIFSDIIEPYKAKIEHGWRILMIGIVMEVVAAFLISVISGLEIADVTDRAAAANLEAKQASKDAALANERASTNELRAAIIESNNVALSLTVEKLRSDNMAMGDALYETIKSKTEVEMALLPRVRWTLMPPSEELKKYAGIRFFVSSEDWENDDNLFLTYKIVFMLRAAGWVWAENVSSDVEKYFRNGEFPKEGDGVYVTADFGNPEYESGAAIELLKQLNEHHIVANKWQHKNIPKNLVSVFVGKRPNLEKTIAHVAQGETNGVFLDPQYGLDAVELWEKEILEDREKLKQKYKRPTPWQ